jgi:hypothetical protein
MLNQKCQHREWLLVKIRGLRNFKIWQCKQCKLLLKERTKGLHEVFILRDVAQNLSELPLKTLQTKIKEVSLPSSEVNTTSQKLSLGIATNNQLESHN